MSDRVRVICPKCGAGGAHPILWELPYCEMCNFEVLMQPVSNSTQSNFKSGTTTVQMLEAPGGSVYFWSHITSLEYAIRLAEHLGRTDLQVHTLSDLDRMDKFKGREINGVVVDHACGRFITTCQSENLTEIERIVNRKELP